LTAELEAERRQHGATREQSNAVSTELMTVKARAEAQAGMQLEQVERLKRVEADLAAARGAAATARGRGGAVALIEKVKTSQLAAVTCPSGRFSAGYSVACSESWRFDMFW
jgi:hypothetical protein